ncbi:uncharacterized protein LOC119662551 isoform X2 [Teleopsis dalmanni]|uniref:uncharacterized protein LOC119662551 isoform X2 n=1 Tax=Teleopsis dalmanni TaxID=139649 RepID=UPI0018CFB577|nr:uncharacterized protein LOC119662551 isoform X2 [Teleopsis dalmanni]
MKRLIQYTTQAVSKIMTAKNQAPTHPTQNINANISSIFGKSLLTTSKKDLQDMTARPIKNTYIEQNLDKAAKGYKKSKTVITRPQCPPVKVPLSQSKTQVTNTAKRIPDNNLGEDIARRKYPEVNKINSYDATGLNNSSRNKTLAGVAQKRCGYEPFHDFLRGIEKNRCQTSREQLQLKAIKHPETWILRPNKKI